MPVIDKNMYKELKEWCDWDGGKRPGHQQIMYVNSHDRTLTNATIRKMIFEMEKEDPHGEMYISFYSAENFCRNMREYYSDIAELYMNDPTEDDTLTDIIEDFPPTCGWIVLVVEDLELLSGKAEKMQKMMESVFTFSTKRPSIILIGDGEYKKVFDGYEFALNKMADGIAGQEDDNAVMVGCYDQEEDPERTNIIYENADDQCDELNFYWDSLYRQLEKRYFDYGDFKNLYRETIEYIIPRVTEEQVYRKDVGLIESIGAMTRENHDSLDGCTPWEFDAAQEFSTGLHNTITIRYGENLALTEGKIEFRVEIKKPDEDFGAIKFSGFAYPLIEISIDTAFSKMDWLSDRISKVTYKGNRAELWKILRNKHIGENVLETVPQEVEDAEGAMISLMDSIKEIAEKTVNREPGRKVRRYKGSDGENGKIQATELRILERNYDVAADKIKGIEKLGQERPKDLDKCKLSRFIVVLDKIRYSINADGEPEMTLAAQKEYNEFVFKIKQTMERENFRVLDEGYGRGEDELEWHITVCVMDDNNSTIAAILEYDTCVRTDDDPESDKTL